MSTTDLTLSNPLIKGFMEGSPAYIPVSELIYIHTHLVQENFLSDIESLIGRVTELSTRKRLRPRMSNKLLQATIDLGAILPNINETTAPKILYILRDIYLICNNILSFEKAEDETKT